MTENDRSSIEKENEQLKIENQRLAVHADIAGRSWQTRDRKLHIYRAQIRQMQERIRLLNSSLANARAGAAAASQLQDIRRIFDASDLPYETTVTAALRAHSELLRFMHEAQGLRDKRDGAKGAANRLRVDNERLKAELADALAKIPPPEIMYAREIECDVKPNAFPPGFVYVTVGTKTGKMEFLRAPSGFINKVGGKTYLVIGLIELDKPNNQALVELPSEADSGANRIWVGLSQFRRVSEDENMAAVDRNLEDRS